MTDVRRGGTDEAEADVGFGGRRTGGSCAAGSGCESVEQRYAYDAYGNPLGFDPDAALTRLQYAGEQADRGTGFGYNRARYYTFATGRFNRMDDYAGNIHDPQTLHKVIYAHGDPVNGFDPLGMFTQAFGYLAEGAITADHRVAFPFPLFNVVYGQWARLPGAFRAKPDILNYTDREYNEIKPLSPSGIARAIAQMALRERQFHSIGFEPDFDWAALPRYTFAGAIPIIYFNLGGVLFYTDAVDLAEDVLAIKVATNAAAAWRLLALSANSLTVAAGRIPQLVAARVSIDGENLNSRISIGGLLASMGVV